jgi:histidinol-phosphate/aromatic aminotransferase/cobyric acid decarboxylase-like protein
MRVEIQIQQDAAIELQNQSAKSAAKRALKKQTPAARLAEEVNQLGLKLEPVNPGQTHPLLAPFFMVEVPDRETAEKVINQLSQNPTVEAAYFHPDESAP